jgi:hypothetical protein
MQQATVYQTLAAHQQSEAWDHQRLMAELHAWWERFNVEFKLSVSSVALCLDRLQLHVLGHHRRGHNAFGLRHEVALNTVHLHNRPMWDVLCTCLHEALHAWQEEHGQPSRTGYHHNREFRHKAGSLGLVVDARGVTTVAEGPFLDLIRRHAIDVPDAFPPVPTHRGSSGAARAGTSKLKRWTCGCGIGVRVAVADFRARCLVCERAFFRDD